VLYRLGIPGQHSCIFWRFEMSIWRFKGTGTRLYNLQKVLCGWRGLDWDRVCQVFVRFLAQPLILYVFNKCLAV
jgi:hypothetical protein